MISALLLASLLQDPELVVQQGHSEAPVAVLVTPDAQSVISASTDGSVRLWNLATGRELRVIASTGGQITCGALAPDGKRLAVGCGDGRSAFWTRRAAATPASPPAISP